MAELKHIILVILFTLGVWAEEVGVPYVDVREAVAQSAALSPDGETFYTYANNTLTHWSLNPVKVIDTVKIEDQEFKKSALIYAISKKDKVIFVKNDSIGLFDVIRQIMIKKIACTGRRFVLHTKKYFYVIDKNRNINVFDIENFNRIKTKSIEKYVADCDECHDYVLFAIKSDDGKTFTILTGSRLIILDSESLEIIKEYGYGIFVNWWQTDSYLMSLDLNTIYTDNKSFNVNTFKIEDGIKNTKKCELNFGSYSKVGILSYVQCDKQKVFYNSKSEKKVATISFFNDGTWLIMTASGYFDGSPESRKYLYIKTPSGESIPIDDEAYNKFHKSINLKD